MNGLNNCVIPDMRILIILMVFFSSCSIGPAEKIDYNDPERIQALEDIYYQMDKNLPVYAIKTDTLYLTTDTLMLLLTVMKNGESVYDDVRYEVLCAG